MRALVLAFMLGGCARQAPASPESPESRVEAAPTTTSVVSIEAPTAQEPEAVPHHAEQQSHELEAAAPASSADSGDRCPCPTTQVGAVAPTALALRVQPVELRVERSLLQEIASDVTLLQARIVQATSASGQDHGLRLFGVRPHTLAGRLGFANGDHLIAINGSPIGDLDHARSLFEQAIQGDRIEIVIERRGTRWTLRYVIE